MQTLKKFSAVATIAASLLCASHASAQLSAFSQNFEGLDQSDTAALEDDGWLVSGLAFEDVFGTEVFRFFYGNFPAPNEQPGAAFSNIETGQGGAAQGLQYLNVFSDYNCCGLEDPTPIGHGNGTDIVESNVFQEQIIGSEDIGDIYRFSFDATLPAGDDAQFALDGSESEGVAFIRTISPDPDFFTTNFITFDTTTLSGDAWTSHELEIDLSDPGLEGSFLQFGFQTRSSDFNPTGAYFDNISFGIPGAALPGDLDGSGTVDGNDFLFWQRDLGDEASLLEWQAAFGAGSLAAVGAVPEPTSVALLLIGTFCIAEAKRRRR